MALFENLNLKSKTKILKMTKVNVRLGLVKNKKMLTSTTVFFFKIYASVAVADTMPYN